MSTLLSDSSQRSWWFSPKLNRQGKDTCRSVSNKSHSKQSHSLKFNTFAQVLGFKQKKLESLTIQEPPRVQPPSPRHAYRQTSNSVSTLRSSLEPRTPSDPPKDPLPFRKSLLTLSDSDPFASQGIISALSADTLHCTPFPTPTNLDPLDRSSYASNSSQSATDIWWRNTLASSASLPERYATSLIFKFF
jgi:hypothetical protein